MATPLKIEPVDATFGAVVTGFRIPEIDDETFQALHGAWLKYALLIFPGQNLTRAEQIAFAKRFGPLEFEMTAISNDSLSSSYYLITRLLYSHIAKINGEPIDYNHPIHQVAAMIPQIGEYGPQRATLYRRPA